MKAFYHTAFDHKVAISNNIMVSLHAFILFTTIK